MADRVFAHVLADEVIAVFDHVDELALRDERQLASSHQHHDQRDGQADDHPEHVLRDGAEHECRVERMLEVRYAVRELFQRIHVTALSALLPHQLENAEDHCRDRKRDRFGKNERSARSRARTMQSTAVTASTNMEPIRPSRRELTLLRFARARHALGKGKRAHQRQKAQDAGKSAKEHRENHILLSSVRESAARPRLQAGGYDTGRYRTVCKKPKRISLTMHVRGVRWSFLQNTGIFSA